MKKRSTQIGELCSIKSGFAFKSNSFNTDGKGVPLIRIRDVKPAFSNTFYDGEYQEEFLISNGDILIGMDGEFNREKWKGGSALLNQRVCKIETVNSDLDQNYLYYLLPKLLKDIERETPFVTVKHLSAKKLAQTYIDLPTIDEQRRIAKILDNFQNLESINNRSIQLNNELSNSLFDEMFGEPLINPRGWIKLELEKLTFKITDGEHINPIFKSEGMPIVMAGNVLENSIDFKNTKFVEEQTGKKLQKKCLPQKDDVLLVSRGATIGRLCLVETTQDFCLMGSVILIKINPEIINPIFLSQLLKQSTMRRLLFKTSSSSAQQAIYLKDLKKLPCIIPPIKTQNLFAKRLHSIKELITRQSTRFIQVNQAFESVSSELMSIKNKKLDLLTNHQALV